MVPLHGTTQRDNNDSFCSSEDGESKQVAEPETGYNSGDDDHYKLVEGQTDKPVDQANKPADYVKEFDTSNWWMWYVVLVVYIGLVIFYIITDSL